MRKNVMVGALSVLIGFTAGATVGRSIESRATAAESSKSDKHYKLYSLMSRWVSIKQEGKNLKEYFEKNSYRTIAVYGMSLLGERLVEELKDSDVCVRYAIDKNADCISVEIDTLTMDDELQAVDAVVVTPVTFFDDIEEKLSEKVSCPIISIEDVLYGV